MEEMKQTAPVGGKKKKTIALVAVIGGILALLLAAVAVIAIIVVAVVLAKPTVKLNDYVTIETTGYNGHGEAEFYFNTEAFCEDHEGDVKFTSSFEEELGKLGVSVDGMPFDSSNQEEAILCFSMFCNTSGTLSEKQELSNGDVITFSWSSPLTGEAVTHIEKMFGVKIVAEDITYTVSGLEDVETFDPFEEITVTFKGISMFTAACETQSPYEFEYGLVYEIKEDVSMLSNGDEVTVCVSHPEYSDEEYVEHYGKLPYPTEKKYPVEGLLTLITDQEMITDGMLAQIDQSAKDYFMQQTVKQNWVEGFTADLHLLGYKFGVMDNRRENKEWDLTNEIGMIYRVDYTLQFTDGSGNPQSYQTSYYYFSTWSFVVFDEEENLLLTPEPQSTPVNTVKFETGMECYYPEYDMVLPLTLMFPGTYTQEEAIEQTIPSDDEIVYVPCE